MADKLIPTEAQEQIKFVTWLGKMNLPYYAIPNGGRRDFQEAIKLKRMGVQAGVPDLCIPIARGIYHGLYIELKRAKGGAIRDTQLYWIDMLNQNGYLAHIAPGCDKAIDIVLNYLSLSGSVKVVST